MPGNRPKLMHFACALINKQVLHPQSKEANPDLPEKVQAKLMSSVSHGYALQYWLDTSYRRVAGQKPSRAAHYKRQAKKRANIRARSGKK